MYTVLIVFPSLTHVQRACRLLESRGCLCVQPRPPAGLVPTRCAYGIRIRADCLPIAKRLLTEAGLETRGIFLPENGAYHPYSGT